MLKSLQLQNFRSHSKASFDFDNKITFIVGPNGAGKTNLLESIYFLSYGRSPKLKDEDIIKFGEEIARVKGKVDETELEVLIQKEEERIKRKFLVNGVSKKRTDFMGNLSVVSFSPLHLDIVIGSPSVRRDFMDSVLENVDREYRFAKAAYDKGLRQRNALLSRVKDGIRVPDREFEYWDRLLIENGSLIGGKREEFIAFVNGQKKEVYSFSITYDKSAISEERFKKYFDAERAVGVTLVGPHRDDFLIGASHPETKSLKDAKVFSSRGQQRLIVLELKIIELIFVELKNGQTPVLLLDDIFSELDKTNIELIADLVGRGQTILSATHRELVKSEFYKNASVIELKKDGKV